jgi:hypothetical protein
LDQAVEGAAQPGAAVASVALGPEQRRQGLAGVRPARHGQVDQQRQRPPQVQLDWPITSLQARRPQHEQLQQSHRAACFFCLEGR